MRAGKNIFKQLSEAYRKIRNTARFILGNLDGFDPNTIVWQMTSCRRSTAGHWPLWMT